MEIYTGSIINSDGVINRQGYSNQRRAMRAIHPQQHSETFCNNTYHICSLVDIIAEAND
jgi:hypothetical protein